jgi:phage tail sheath gpL-like
VYAIPTGNHGWIKLNASGVSSGFYSMVSAYFERTNTSNTSLTLMAQSNNSAQAALNMTNSATGTGTVQITIQLSGNNIQAKSVPASMAVAVRVTIF